MNKQDYKKDFKDLYLPKNKSVLLEVPPIRFVVVDGTGDPNGDDFAEATGALYSFSYTVKMIYKSPDAPEGIYEYTVFPLEGVWDLVDKKKPSTDKSNYAWSIMIRQPDYLTESLFELLLAQTRKKKPNPWLDKLRMETIREGLCCQMLHLGSYDEEPASFAAMEEYCRDQGYQRKSKIHREIYLSDPRKTEPEKLKTVLRFQVEKG